MSSAPIGVVLSHLRKLAAARNDEDRPDHQLLDRFARFRDEAAFAALLWRHGPMVLGVCQSVLHNLHDAEDAFQAVFLVLARKAGSIHRREAVSSWLHRVAYHLAVKALARAARRKVHEQRAVTMPPADPVLDMSLRELRSVLNEELQQLRDDYRAPVVLCCLEEKSLEEAARLLGWSKWTVKGRLQRGRDQLRARLRRRGLALSAGLFATVLTTRFASAKVSAPLTAVTLKAALRLAAGEEAAAVVPARVAALAQAARTTVLPSNARIATVLLLAMGAAVAVGALRLGASAADPPSAPRSPESAGEKAGTSPPSAPSEPKAEEMTAVSGRVLDPTGNPFAGARLYLASPTAKGMKVRERATSGPDGRFRFSLPRGPLVRWRDDGSEGRTQVLASAPGYGPDWVALDAAGPVHDVTLRLVRDVPVHGRVLDPDGQPVAGATVAVRWLSVPRGDDLAKYLDEVRKGYGSPLDRIWKGPLPGQPAVLITGADGRFQLMGAGRERILDLVVEGPAIASASIDVMTRTAATVTGPNHRRVYGASFDHVAAASRPIRGVVRDQDTGRPLAGVSVGLPQAIGPKPAVTDRAGRYELRGLSKRSRYRLVAKPADGRFFERHITLQDGPGLGALTCDIDLIRGLTVRGRVTDRATGKPIVAARVDYYPLGGNTYVNARIRGSWDPHSQATTGSDGAYALTALPGPGVIGVTAPEREAYMPANVTRKERTAFFKTKLLDDRDEEYLTRAAGANAFGGVSPRNHNAVVLLEPGEKEETLVRDVALDRPVERRGRVVGPDGRPLTGAAVIGLVPYRFSVETLDGPEFTVRGINPRATRPLVFYHKDKNLGLYLKELRGDPSEVLTVRLQPCGSASGRVVDPDGQPVAGLRLHVPGMATYSVGEDRWVTTDRGGHFRADGLVPGQEYWVWDASGSFPRVFARVVVESGKNKDMGDIKMRERRP